MFASASECNVNGQAPSAEAQPAGLGAIEAPPVLAHEAAHDAASRPLVFVAGDPGGARLAAGSRPRAGRRGARRALRRPGGDGADPRRRRGGLLLGARPGSAHPAHRRALSETLARHGGPLSRRLRGASHHSGRSGVAHPLYRPDAIKARRIDRPRAHQDGAASRPALRRRRHRGGRAAGDRRAAIVSGYGTAREGDW